MSRSLIKSALCHIYKRWLAVQFFTTFISFSVIGVYCECTKQLRLTPFCTYPEQYFMFQELIICFLMTQRIVNYKVLYILFLTGSATISLFLYCKKQVEYVIISCIIFIFIAIATRFIHHLKLLLDFAFYCDSTLEHINLQPEIEVVAI